MTFFVLLLSGLLLTLQQALRSSRHNENRLSEFELAQACSLMRADVANALELATAASEFTLVIIDPSEALSSRIAGGAPFADLHRLRVRYLVTNDALWQVVEELGGTVAESNASLGRGFYDSVGELAASDQTSTGSRPRAYPPRVFGEV